MKPKMMLYAGIGYATVKVGKMFAKRKAKAVLSGSKSNKKS